ncbi:uncharacterized protein LOC128547297 [Mercenaria mercenaria]|uniref:uncharacterized protein LOC128547297 n=1 Tax=Mercenaria mercenaria TaxID=6596 RepID=UPI00234E3FA3|nr:uncharacterized protein LOC128547297 [Mercenaria mercenaria]
MASILVFSAFVCLLPSAACGLEKGEVAYKVWKISDDVNRFYVTDGSVVVKATTSKSLEDMTSCIMHTSVKKGQKLLKSAGVTIENIGEDQIILMKQKCRQYQRIARRASSLDDNDSFNHDLVQDKPFKGDFETGAPSGAGSHFAIYPGTKWCGYENVAENMQDLGVHNETDACCRTHDHCPYYIDRFQTKYHYFNHDPWTLSHCDCDQHLYDCLKKVETPTSDEVGKLFFGLLDVQCFKFKTGEYCPNESSILSHLWCGKKNKGVMAVMQEFPHKWNEDESSSDIVG